VASDVDALFGTGFQQMVKDEMRNDELSTIALASFAD